MKVGFNARLLCEPTLRGWNRYTINLLIELARQSVELFLYSDQPLHPVHLTRLPANSYSIRVAPPMRYPWWEQYWLPQQAKLDRVDILHCPLNFGLPIWSPCPTVLTLHDAIDQIYYGPQTPLAQKFSLGYWQNRWYHWVARSRADKIITVSEYSKTDLVKFLNLPASKVAVIYEAADPRFHQPVSADARSRIRTAYQLKHPYIFYVGGWEKRKNIPFLLQAFAQANLQDVNLVLAGGNDQQKTTLLELAQALEISESLILLDWVEEEDLPALYAEALCFVYPSEYEGFGLQLCEAMAVGCPVLAARTTCLSEILGSGGETFGLEQNPAQLVELLTQLWQDPTFRNKLAARAVSRSQNFAWGKTAKQTMDVYARCQDN